MRAEMQRLALSAVAGEFGSSLFQKPRTERRRWISGCGMIDVGKQVKTVNCVRLLFRAQESELRDGGVIRT